MPILPNVSWDTCRKVEKCCVHSWQAKDFVGDVWSAVAKQNPNLAQYWYRLFQILQHPIWGGLAMISVCQLYRALEIEMVKIPRVESLAFRIVDGRIFSDDGYDYWRKKQNAFHNENKELSKLLISTSEDGLPGRNRDFSRMVVDTTITFYMLIEEQERLERSPIIIVVPKSA